MPSPSPAWTDWTVLPGAPTYTAAALAELLDGGQAFRWYRQPDQSWRGQWADHIVGVRLAPRDSLEWSAPHGSADRTAAALRHYLGLTSARHAEAWAALPLRADPHLATCVAAFPGLRILRQPFGETLLAFLCSATKQIVQIKQMLALLAARLGDPLPDLPPPADTTTADLPAPALPTWPRLAAASEAELRACQLGFRARYIKATADRLAAAPGWLEATAALPYAEAKVRLLTLPGVGEKIADCVLLFGLGHLAAFPVDTWMIKAMTRRYGLHDWSPAQVAHFGRVHYGPAAGLAQQYLFAWERAHGARGA